MPALWPKSRPRSRWPASFPSSAPSRPATLPEPIASLPGMTPDPRGIGRWWVYQRERFPVVAHGVLILAFSLCAVCFSALLRGADHLPAWPVIVVAFCSSFFSFLHLRLADEFKDSDEDAR